MGELQCMGLGGLFRLVRANSSPLVRRGWVWGSGSQWTFSSSVDVDVEGIFRDLKMDARMQKEVEIVSLDVT